MHLDLKMLDRETERDWLVFEVWYFHTFRKRLYSCVCSRRWMFFFFFVHFSNVWKLTCKYFLCMFLDPGIMLCSDLLEWLVAIWTFYRNKLYFHIKWDKNGLLFASFIEVFKNITLHFRRLHFGWFSFSFCKRTTVSRGRVLTLWDVCGFTKQSDFLFSLSRGCASSAVKFPSSQQYTHP